MIRYEYFAWLITPSVGKNYCLLLENVGNRVLDIKNAYDVWIFFYVVVWTIWYTWINRIRLDMTHLTQQCLIAVSTPRPAESPHRRIGCLYGQHHDPPSFAIGPQSSLSLTFAVGFHRICRLNPLRIHLPNPNRAVPGTRRKGSSPSKRLGHLYLDC